MRRLYRAEAAERVTLNPDVVRARCAEIEESVQRLEALAAVPLADHRSRSSHARRRPASSDADGSSSAW